MIRIAVAGAMGRMGRRVLESAARDPEFHPVTALVAPDDELAGTRANFGDRDVPVASRLDAECDVLIDFSTPAGTVAWIDICERRDIPMVIGVTGHDAAQITRIREAAHQIPIVQAANFSAGINAVLRVLESIIIPLGDGFDVEIVETHHRNKVDAPSGTALEIARTVRHALESRRGATAGEASNRDPIRVIHGRSGATGVRPARQIAVHAVRMGDVVGTHEIHLGGRGETITIRHEARSRDTFAEGALRAVRWIVAQRPGYYTMLDVLDATARGEPEP